MRPNSLSLVPGMKARGMLMERAIERAKERTIAKAKKRMEKEMATELLPGVLFPVVVAA